MFDSHAHIITDDIQSYPPSPMGGLLPAGALDDPIPVERLLRHMDAAGVDRAVLVQRAHIYGFNNSYVVDSASAYPDRFTAIGMIDGTADDVEKTAIHWIDRGVVGLRLTEPFKGANTTWMAGAPARKLAKLCAKAKVSIGYHFYRWNRDACLGVLPAVLDGAPGIVAIIDHLSNIKDDTGPPDFGIDEALVSILARSGVYSKITSINLARVAAAGLDLAGFGKAISERLPADRLMWGSDVGQTKGGYAQMVDMMRNVSKGLSEAAAMSINQSTAQAVLMPK